MNERWFYELPDFLNKDIWIEDRPMDCSTDATFSRVETGPLGSAPDHLYLGMVIRRRSRADLRLIVDEYRLRHGREAFILKWWIEGDEDIFGIAAKDPSGGWILRRPGEIPCWILTYNQKKNRMKHFGVAFRKRKKGELN